MRRSAAALVSTAPLEALPGPLPSPQRMNNPRAKVQTNQQRKTRGTTQQQVTDKAPTQQPTSKNQHQPPINNRHRKINRNEEARAYNQQCTPKLRPPQQRNKRWRPCSQAHLSQCSRGSRDMMPSDGYCLVGVGRLQCDQVLYSIRRCFAQ